MSNLSDFLSRNQTDHSFYVQFRQDPEEALAPYKLSAEDQAAVTGSREQLWTYLGRSSSCWKYSCNYVLLEAGDTEFRPGIALEQENIQNAIVEIRSATTDEDRLLPVLALMDQIG